jgi:hypothetical protein
MRYTSRGIKIAYIVFLVFTSQSLHSQDINFDINENVIRDRIKKTVYHLSSPMFRGRSTLTGDDIFASQYIDSLFKTFSINPFSINPVSTNFQQFSIIKSAPQSRTAKLLGQSFQYGIDFLTLGVNPLSNKDYRIVFGGLGNYEDIESLDLEGKALLVLTNNLKIGGMRISEIAAEKGCSLIILANPKSQKQFESIYHQLYEQHNSTLFRIEKDEPESVSRFFSRLKNPVPQIIISDNFARALLGDKPFDIYQDLLDGGEIKVIPSELKVKFDFQYLVDTIYTQNVVSWIPSSNGSEKSVLVCAHYDHLAPEGQTWYPGADDNASSIAVLMELARLYSDMAKNGYQPRRNIVFAAFSGEEIGLLGSHYYSHNPIFPIDSTTIVLNMDMLGRMGNQKQRGRSLLISGDNQLDDFSNILNKINPDPDIKIDAESLVNISLFSLSDHYYFMEKGAPAFLLTTGIHTDYHTPTDTPDKIEFESMVDIIELVFETIKYFADEPNPWLLN